MVDPEVGNHTEIRPLEATVIIAAYNAEQTIERAVKSALCEPEAVEVVVVDDASSDQTTPKALSADDGTGRLKVLRQPTNQGPSAARNKAIANSHAPWLCVLDADDYFQPGRLARLSTHAHDCDFVADDLLQALEASPTEITQSLSGGSILKPEFINLTDFVEGNITRKGEQRRETGFLKPLMRRAFLERFDLSYREHIRLGEDYELYARALAHGGLFKLVPAAGYVSVVRASSLSGRHTEEDLLNLRECDNNLIMLAEGNRTAQKALQKHFLSIDCRYQWRRLILAVKRRDALSALATFLRPPPVPFYLSSMLFEQLCSRLSSRLKL